MGSENEEIEGEEVFPDADEGQSTSGPPAKRSRSHSTINL